MRESRDVWCGRIRLSALAEAYYVKGAKMEQLARVARVSADAISKAFKRHGYTTRWSDKHCALTEHEIRRAIAAGMSQSELARKTGISQGSVSRTASRYGIEWPEYEYAPALTRDQLLDAIGSGLSQVGLAKRERLSKATIQRYCRLYGIRWGEEKKRIRQARAA